jgi:3-hydroxyacyl-[acyl-carrier protein] dehydratase/trans-2-decenoyl-[acyl-carrier protein] isomerase
VTFAEFRARSRFEWAELVAFAHGTLVADAPAGFAARLPLPPLLMVDRIVDIAAEGSRGRVVAERDVHPGDWFFQCHFAGDPVQPGCLGLDAVWQLVGFFCAWRGGLGVGRALGCGEVAFEGQIRPENRVVRWEVAIRRRSTFADANVTLAIADAHVFVDDTSIYTIKGARVGLFPNLAGDGKLLASTAAPGYRVA